MVYSDINLLHRSYDALVCPLLFLYEKGGWHLDKGEKKITSTARHFNCYKLFDRDTELNTLLRFDRLFQHYLAYKYFKWEKSNCNFIRNNQGKLDASGNTSFRKVLPSSAGFQDEIVLVRAEKMIDYIGVSWM